MFRICLVLVCCTVLASGADKPVKPAQAGNQLVELVGTIANDRPGVTEALGMDPGIDMVVVTIKVTPKGDNKLDVNRDDFTLISRRDGQRSLPLSPGQLAGQGAIMVTSSGIRNASGMRGANRGPVVGGVPGTGTRPRRAGGESEASGGGGGAQAEAKVIHADKENPLLAVLKAKILPEGQTLEPVSGQLYFLLEGKHKPKDLDLLYKTAEGLLEVDFVK